ncbi:Zinc finger BED domain-containing protein DAYSLEEPER [Striga hermonthica]|uniref:Zinc finger BED domain-containing protein DAYSLEEPER n=1 Tax=Striga hermonthica TaxID=68872 RepID=A0A9N7MME5_STRHE|nr:Zinc finger BED domain-containing protein DAYSLEEPER [Striga hermonthica]
MEISITDAAYPGSDAQPKNSKRRRKKSMVWDHFTIETVNPNCTRASCNQCKRSFAYISGTKLAGTSHLKRHIASGICPVVRHSKEKDELSPESQTPRTNISANGSNLQRKRYRAGNGVARIQLNGHSSSYNVINSTSKINASNFSHELAKLIIQHDYPLCMAEHSGFIDFARSLQPQLNINSLGSVQEQIIAIYNRGKQKVVDLLTGIPGRVNLMLHLWTSTQGLDYFLLTGQFTDYDWKLQRRVLNFSAVNFPNSEMAFNGAVTCINEWSLEGKVFTVNLNSGCPNENARENLRNVLSIKNPVILKGQLLIKSCYACVLRSLAMDAIGSVKEAVEKVRKCVKYIKTSGANEEKFNKLKQLLQVPSTRDLMMDDVHKWDTTFQMLTAACEVKQVFSCLDTSGLEYKSTPSMEEWRLVEILCTFLKIFQESARKLTSPLYLPANMFFREASDIYLELMHAAWSQDPFISTLIKPLHEKFTKYWEENFLVLATAAVLDPRIKVELVESKLLCMYGQDVRNWASTVGESLHQLYVEYEADNLVKSEVVEPHEDILLTEGDDLLNFDVDISDFMEDPDIKSELDEGCVEEHVFHENNMKSGLERHLEENVFQESPMSLELDRYLQEPLEPYDQEIDVLGWWRMCRSRYPILSRIACDVLSVPFIAIPPENVFDDREKRLEQYGSSLCPRTLQAVVCAKDWVEL